MAKKNDKNTLLYKGRPLVRNGNTIYYGNMEDEYVAMLQIMDSGSFQDMTLPSRVSVQIISTNPDIKPQERIKKRTDKNTLYDAVNIASIWLERMLDE